MRKLYSTILFLISFSSMWAQYDTHHTQFMHNKLSINPAYAGDRGVFAMTAIYRNQWFGINGAPKTFTLHAHSPFLNKRNGIGLSIINDRIGVLNTSYIGTSYAYRMPVTEGASLNIGLQARVEHSQLDWSKSDPLDQNDASIPANMTSKTNPNFGIGLFYSHQDYYVGLSVPSLLETTVYDENLIAGTNINAQRTYYLMGGMVMRLTHNIKFAPALLISYNPNAPFEFDLNANFILMEKLWLGLSFRLEDSVDALLMFQLTDQFRIGAAFDYTLSNLQEFSPGSFEVLLDYNFSFKGKRLNNIRFF